MRLALDPWGLVCWGTARVDSEEGASEFRGKLGRARLTASAVGPPSAPGQCVLISVGVAVSGSHRWRLPFPTVASCLVDWTNLESGQWWPGR